MTAKLILCDLGNTLIRFEHQRAAAVALKFLLTHPGRLHRGIPQPDALFRFVFGPREDGPSRNVLLEIGQRDTDWLVDELNAEMGIQFTVQEFEAIWNSIFTSAIPEMFEAMRDVRKRGIRVALCSNTTRSHWEWLLGKFPELEDFQAERFLSYEMGVTKTQPGFFEKILERTRLEPEELLFIDDLEENLAPARGLGIRVLRFSGQVPDLALFNRS